MLKNGNIDMSLLWDYQNLDIQHLKKEELYSVPFYNATLKEYLAFILHALVNRNKAPIKNNYIIPFSFQELYTSHKKKSMYPFAHSSFINLPVSNSIIWLANKFNLQIPEAFKITKFFMQIVHLAHMKEFTFFFIGNNNPYIDPLLNNLKRAYPSFRVVGKHNQPISENQKNVLNEAIRKISPHFIILSLGKKQDKKWIKENHQIFDKSIIISLENHLEKLVRLKEVKNNHQIDKPTYFITSILLNPLKWYKVHQLIYVMYSILRFQRKK